LLERDFTALEPQTKWVTDISGSRLAKASCTSASIRIFSIKCRGLFDAPPARPENDDPGRTDGGLARSGDYQAYPKANGPVCSMSPVGHFGDNAACEGFFWLFKRERVYRTKYPTLDAARDDVFEYIERFHNPGMRRRTARQDLKFSTPSRPSVASWESPDESSMNLRRRIMLTVKDRGYNSLMPKDVVLDSSGDLRERSLAVLISVALHLAAFGWM